MNQQDKELALRSHIRNLLLDYALTHLTTNYGVFTQDAVANLLSESLRPISTTDPTSLALQPSFQDAVARIYMQDTSLKPFQELWKVETEVTQYLRQRLSVARDTKPPTERCWICVTEENSWDYYQPMSPILTRRALRETPKLGTNKHISLVGSSHAHALQKYGIQAVELEDMPEVPKMKLDDALDMKLSIDVNTHSEVMNLLKSTHTLSRKNPSHPDGNLFRDFLQSDSSTYYLPPSDSPPLFPRDANPAYEPYKKEGSKNIRSSYKMAELSDLASFLPIQRLEVEDEYDDLYKQHLAVVNGWQCFQEPSSPASPTPHSCSDDELDQLFDSPATTEPLYIEELKAAEMDEYEMPRTEKMGGSNIQPKLPGAEQSLSEFLKSVIKSPITRAQVNRMTDNPPRSEYPPSPSSIISDSMFGQPPSVIGEGCERAGSRIDKQMALDVEDIDDLSTVMRKLHGVNGSTFIGLTEDPLGVILNEKLDEKEGYLMDVPKLPPANEYPRNDFFLPNSLKCLLIPSSQPTNSITQLHPDIPRGFLRKVKGLQSLNIELSWRPFNYGTSIPTHEQLSKVDENVQVMIIQHISRQEPNPSISVTRLLETVSTPVDDPACPSASYWNSDFEGDLFSVSIDQIFPEAYLLTRTERRRALGLQEDDDSKEECQDFDSVEDRHVSDTKLSSNLPREHPTKRARYQRSPQEHLQLDEDAEAGGPVRSHLDRTGVDVQRSTLPLQLDAKVIPEHDDESSGLEYLGDPENHCQVIDDSGYADGSSEHIFSAQIQPVSQMISNNYYFEIGQAGYDHFVPLSFESTQRTAYNEYNNTPVENALPNELVDVSSAPPNDPALSHQDAGVYTQEGLPPVTDPKPSNPEPNYPTSRPRLSSRHAVRHSLATFLDLRAKAISDSNVMAASSSDDDGKLQQTLPVEDDNEALDIAVQAPPELFDRNTLRLAHPPNQTAPDHRHKYLASLSLFSKRLLLRYLASSAFAIDLTERETLGGPHLILDPDTAIFLTPLLALPSPGQVESLVEVIGDLSWRFGNILVIFEGFPESGYYRPEAIRVGTDPFSPPVLKSLKKLKRDLSLSETYSLTKRSEEQGAAVHFAFALEVEDVARFVRFYGDLAERHYRSSVVGDGGVDVWGEREWIEEEYEGENDLSGFSAMNVFAAACMLSRISLEGLLDMTDEERNDMFGDDVGLDRLSEFNRVLARRKQAMLLPSSSPIRTTSPLSADPQNNLAALARMEGNLNVDYETRDR